MKATVIVELRLSPLASGRPLNVAWTNMVAFAVAPQAGWAAQILHHINAIEHMRDFTRGVVDTRQVVFYLSLTFWFLFLTLRVVESRRWK